jgi:hypothetical protein
MEHELYKILEEILLELREIRVIEQLRAKKEGIIDDLKKEQQR